MTERPQAAVDNTEAKEEGVLTPERVNTGIAIAVPFERIQDVFELSEANETTRSSQAQQPTPLPDSDVRLRGSPAQRSIVASL